MRNFVTGLAAIASLAFAAPAMADPITLDSGDVGSGFTVDFDGFSGSAGNTIDGLTSSISFVLDSVTDTSYTFSYLVDNTTGDGLTSRVSSFAFNVDPDITGATSTGDYPFSFVADGKGSDPSYPNQIGAVDVCFKAKSSGSCSNGDGVSQGNTGSGTLTLNFGSVVDSITLSDFFARYQGISGAGGVTSASGQGTISSTSTSSTSTGGTPVPAPGMLGLLALALTTLGFMRSRSRRPSREQAQPAFA
jgi:hypothetical protein